MVGTRLCTVLRCVGTTRAFRVRCGFVAWSTVLGGFTTLVRMRRGVIDLANVHLGGRADDIDLDVWSVLGMAQPAQHPRILEEERTSDIGCESWGDAREELTMSVLSTSLAVAIRPSEKEGSAVLSMRTIAIFAWPSEVSGDSDGGLSEPSNATL